MYLYVRSKKVSLFVRPSIDARMISLCEFELVAAGGILSRKESTIIVVINFIIVHFTNNKLVPIHQIKFRC